jgi:predicted O-methyltransferase YrrM
MTYEFTRDWFKTGEQVWPEIRKMMTRRRYFLEIGSYEGRSTVWTIEHMMDDASEITCIDTWEGGEEHGSDNMEEVERRFDYNISLAQSRFPGREVCKIKKPSHIAMAELIYSSCSYDFIYIDGSHKAKDVLTDSCMAWKALNKHGFLVWDDYLWGHPRDVLNRPKAAIDAFMMMFGEEMQVVFLGYHMVVQKMVGNYERT